VRVPIWTYLFFFTIIVQADAFQRNDNFPTVTIKAYMEGGRQLDKMSLRRLIAWRRGDLYIDRYSQAVISLHVEEVLKGNLHDPNFPERPTGVNNLNVVVINDAAIALEKSKQYGIKGQWTLSRLPDGAYFVTDANDTPLKSIDITPEKNAIINIVNALKSGDADCQNTALQRLKDIKCFSCVELLFPLLDSKTKVIVPNGMHVLFRSGVCEPFPVESTLGAQARRTLVRLTAPLRTRYSPTVDDDEQVWHKWWKQILNTDPFPVLEVVPGTLTLLMELPMNQTWPQPRLSPKADSALVGVSRYQYPVDGARSGIVLLNINEPEKPNFTYKVPLEERNCEPTGLASAWSSTHAAIAWKEYFYDEKLARVKFMALDFKRPVGIPVDLGLKHISHMALCPLVPGYWLLACTAKPQDYDPTKRSDRKRREIFLLKLDSFGNILGQTQPLDISVQPHFSYHDGVRVFSAASTPKGPVLAYVNEDKGAFLLLLDHKLEIRGLSQINDPKSSGHGFMPRIAWNGNVLCVSWIQIDNYQDRLFARQFDIDGEPLTDVQLIAEPVGTMADPVSCEGGFIIAWTDFSQTPNQVRLCIISNNGAHQKQQIVFVGKDLVNPIELGLSNGSIKVMMCDREFYPYRLLLKEIELQNVFN
jgi:hypothetical protein